MHRHAFANAIVWADPKVASAIDESHVLRLTAENRAFVDRIGRAERSEPLDHGVGANLAAISDCCILLDDNIRSDSDAGTKSGGRADDCRRVNVHTRSILPRLNLRSTEHSYFARNILPIELSFENTRIRAAALFSGNVRVPLRLGMHGRCRGARLRRYRVLKGLEEWSRDGYVSPHYFALLYTGLCEKDSIRSPITI